MLKQVVTSAEPLNDPHCFKQLSALVDSILEFINLSGFNLLSIAAVAIKPIKHQVIKYSADLISVVTFRCLIH